MKLERIALVLTFVIVLCTFMFFADSNHKGKLYPQAHHSAAQLFGPLQNKQIVFADEFNGSAINTKNWATCYDWKKPSETGCTNDGNFEQQWYSDSQIAVKDGKLTITAMQKPIDVAVNGRVKTFTYQSGMLNSGSGRTNGKVHWAGTYGYYETRMFVSKGQGIWPAFWLLPTDQQWPPEIDGMEFIGSKPGEILQTVHWRGENGPAKDESVIAKNTDYANAWHTYGVDWQPGQIDWYIDGVKTKTFKNADVPAKPMEIIFDLAVGGLLPGNADASTPLPATLKVDYVRVYQSKSQIRPVNQ